MFSLDQVVLFPRALLSIQMPQAKQLLGLGDYISLDAEICLGLLKGNKENLGEKKREEEVFRIACLGRIINKESGDKNGYKFLVEGTERCRIIERLRHKPVMLAKVETLSDFVDITKKAEVQTELQQLLDLCQQLVYMLPHFRPIIKSIIATAPHPAIIADLITYTFIKDPYAKISILGELDTLRRIRLVAVQMRNIFTQLSRQHHREGL